MKCIDDEIPFEIPEGWEWIRLSSIVSILGDGIHGTPEYDDAGDIFFINGNNLNNGKIIIKADTKRLNRTEANKHRRALDKNTILVSINGTIGNIAFYNNENIILGKSACYFNILGNIDKNYIKLIIESDYFISYAKSVATGSTIKNVPLSGMRNFLVPLPPIKEQTRIVSKMSDLSVCINYYSRLQKEVNRLNHNIFTQFERSILQEAIQGKLVPQDPNDEPASVLLERIREEKQRLLKEGKLKKKDITDSIIFKGEDNKYYEQIGQEIVDISEDIPFEIPESWSWIRLSNICSICTGATFKKEDATQNQRGVRILRGGNILPFRICIKDDDIFIPRDAVKYNILLRQNDIVTPAVTSLENIGKMARIESDMPTTTVGGFVFILRPYLNDDILSEYLLSAMSAPATVEFMRSITNKSGQAFYNIGKERLSTTLIPVPPHVEQKRIIENIKHLFSKLS